MSDYDVIVVGAGPGGYVAAIRAAQLGMKTAIVEREHLGGICLNWGCIPTKALLHSAKVLDTIKHAEEFGIKGVAGATPDITTIIDRSRAVSGHLTTGIGFLLKKNKVDIIWGEAKLKAPSLLSVVETLKPAVQPQHAPPKGVKRTGEYKAKNIILATGARPRVLPGLEPDGDKIWTYFEAMYPPVIPSSLIVVGSGAIGIEFASFYSSMGIVVTVVEAMDQIMPLEDPEIAAVVQKRLTANGVTFLPGAKVTGVSKSSGGVTATLEGADGASSKVKADAVISAAGVVANTEGLGLEELGVELDRGCVKTDANGATTVPGVWAIGDVAGPPMLAHKASHDGLTTVAAIAGQPTHPVAGSSIPRCTYCEPQVASIGLTEAQALERGKIKVGRFPFAANGKALAIGESEGVVKIIFDDATGELIGAHLVGPEATELISGLSLGMSLEATEEALSEVVFAHPTISEALHEAVLSAMGRAIHV
jgi:dihydrolipoamide dehydrogenase